MSRRAKMIRYGSLGLMIPQSESQYLNAIFEAAALRPSDGMVKRKIKTVEEMSSKGRLLAVAKSRGFCVSKLGGYYLIHHAGVLMEKLV